MTYTTNLTRFARWQGDPKVLSTGPSSLDGSDRLAKALGWFSIGLGLAELLLPRLLTRALGVEGQERLMRLYGARELGAGMVTLSADKSVGLKARVAGDALDLATLAPLLGRSRKGDNVALALAAVLGVTLLDIVGAAWVRRNQSRSGEARSYRDRSGYPAGLQDTRAGALHSAHHTPAEPVRRAL